jgi:hypothetical protein
MNQTKQLPLKAMLQHDIATGTHGLGRIKTKLVTIISPQILFNLDTHITWSIIRAANRCVSRY